MLVIIVNKLILMFELTKVFLAPMYLGHEYACTEILVSLTYVRNNYGDHDQCLQYHDQCLQYDDYDDDDDGCRWWWRLTQGLWREKQGSKSCSR